MSDYLDTIVQFQNAQAVCVYISF